MNERVKQLAEQARQDYLKRHWPSGISSDSVGMYPQLMERFAELIVGECMSIAYAYDAPKMSGPGMIIANRIDTHFGVEE